MNFGGGELVSTGAIKKWFLPGMIPSLSGQNHKC